MKQALGTNEQPSGAMNNPLEQHLPNSTRIAEWLKAPVLKIDFPLQQIAQFKLNVVRVSAQTSARRLPSAAIDLRRSSKTLAESGRKASRCLNLPLGKPVLSACRCHGSSGEVGCTAHDQKPQADGRPRWFRSPLRLWGSLHGYCATEWLTNSCRRGTGNAREESSTNSRYT